MTTTELIRPRHKDAPQAFDYEAAIKEGWTISDCGTYTDGSPRIELQKIDNPETGGRTFSEDRDAWEYVVARARQGSPLHIQALDMIGRCERIAIQAHCGTW